LSKEILLVVNNGLQKAAFEKPMIKIFFWNSALMAQKNVKNNSFESHTGENLD
jgi:hypothetical protein